MLLAVSVASGPALAERLKDCTLKFTPQQYNRNTQECATSYTSAPLNNRVHAEAQGTPCGPTAEYKQFTNFL